jgi:hypothetical protein
MALGLYETDYGGSVILYGLQRASFQKGEAMIVNLNSESEKLNTLSDFDKNEQLRNRTTKFTAMAN